MKPGQVCALERQRASALGLHVVDTGRSALGWYAQVVNPQGKEAIATRCEDEGVAISAAIDSAIELRFIPTPLLFCQTVRRVAGHHRAIAPERN